MRAVLEGVAFGLADSFDLLRALGVDATVARASGGGARSDLWLRICASVLGVPVCRMSVDEGSAFGAALLGGVAGGLFADVDEAVEACVRVRDQIDPEPGLGRALRRTPRALPRALPGSQGGARMTLAIGMLSTARINAKLAAGARASSRTRVVAIASRQLDRAEAQARELGIEGAHGSYEAMLADPAVEAVYISLPNEMHHEWTMRALAAGKHVLCEKPYSRSAAAVEEGVRGCRGRRPRARGGAHVAASPAGAAARRAGRGRRDRRAAARARRLQLPARRPARRAPAGGARRRRHDGRRLLLHQRRAAAGRRARERHRAAAARRRRASTGASSRRSRTRATS